MGKYASSPTSVPYERFNLEIHLRKAFRQTLGSQKYIYNRLALSSEILSRLCSRTNSVQVYTYSYGFGVPSAEFVKVESRRWRSIETKSDCGAAIPLPKVPPNSRLLSAMLIFLLHIETLRRLTGP